MTVVTAVEECAVPVAVAFGYVNDYRTLTSWVYGAQSFGPVTEQTSGVGAKFDGAVKVGPVKLAARIEVVRWEENAVIAIKSIKGFEIESTFLFEAKDDENCVVDAVLDYRVPGGFAGRALGRTLEPLMKLTIKHTADNLRKQVLEHHARQQG
jgi:uncharacterized membrane protein